MFRLLSAFVLGALLCVNATADDPPKAEPLPALTADEPAVDAAQAKQIRALIAQLGDTTWSKREAAARALEEFGEPVIPFLKDAQASEDAEIRARAEAIVKALTPSVDVTDETVVTTAGGINLTGNFVARGHLVLRGGGGPAGISVKSTARFVFKGRQFQVVRVTDGTTTSLTMEITEPKDGKETHHTVEAASDEEFQRRAPELFKIYVKRVGNLAERQTEMRENYSRMFKLP